MSERTGRWLGLALGVLALAVGALLLAIVFRKPEAPPAVVARRPVVRVQLATPRDLVDVLTLPGRIEAWRVATLAAAKAGVVTDLLVDRGATVTNGQTLGGVDRRVWAASLERARTERDDAERQLARLAALQAEGAVASNVLDAAQTRHDAAVAAVAELAAHLAQCTVTAPFPGLINNRFVEVGNHVPEGGALYELVDSGRVKVVVEVSERDVAALAVATPVTFTLGALPGVAFTGQVGFVAAAAEPGRSVFRVELAAENPDGRLRPGMLAAVAVPRGWHRGSVVVPLEAVLPMRGEHVVFLEAGGHALRRVVRIAALVGQEAVLADGVNAGERVIVEGQRTLADGLPVTARE